MRGCWVECQRMGRRAVGLFCACRFAHTPLQQQCTHLTTLSVHELSLIRQAGTVQTGRCPWPKQLRMGSAVSVTRCTARKHLLLSWSVTVMHCRQQRIRRPAMQARSRRAAATRVGACSSQPRCHSNTDQNEQNDCLACRCLCPSQHMCSNPRKHAVLQCVCQVQL
jgi:hypothetical protein